MFKSLSDNLSKIFDKITRRGFLTEDDVNSSMREIRIALLEADVALPTVKYFIDKVKEDIVGQDIVKSISPGQMVIKLVQDNLAKMLGSEDSALNLAANPPAVIMMVGLQGSGKTTSTAKLALHIKNKLGKRPLVASLDTYRPAAQEQLAVFAKSANIDSLEIIKEQKPLEIAKRALEEARLSAYDVLLLDTAGRLHIDTELMTELIELKALAKPIEILFVADSMTGQDAVNIAKSFNEQLGITGSILTRIDGDTRGGAALSIKHITNCPIKFLGTGEKVNELEVFHSDRIASRILDKGDIISLVEKAAAAVSEEDAMNLAKKVQKGQFDLNDLASQINSIKKMGGVSSMLGFLPGIGKLKEQMNGSNFDEKLLARQQAIIYSMTKGERKNPKIINASRKIRIAKGSGVEVQDVNKLLKYFADMQTMMKKFGKMDKKSLMRSGLGSIFS